MRILHTSILVALGAFFVTGPWTVPAAQAVDPEERASDRAKLEEQIEKEKRVRAETDQAVRRVATMLSVLEFYGIDSGERKKMLEEVGKTLSKLNREQMAEVISRLNSAARAVATDAAKSEKETLEAFEKHNEIMRELRKIMSTFDSLRNLEQAAEQLEKLAREQQDVYTLTKRVISVEEEKLTGKKEKLKNHDLNVSRQREEQNQLEREVLVAFDNIKALLPKLPPDQQERVQKMQKRAGERQVVENLGDITQKLQTPTSKARVAQWRLANQLQDQTAANLVELAVILRTPVSNIDVLKEAIKKIDEAIVNQEKVTKETQTQQEKIEPDPSRPIPANALTPENQKKLDAFKAANPKSVQEAKTLEKDLLNRQAKDKVQDLAKDQGKIEKDTADIRNLVEPLVKEAANDLAKVEKEMQASKDALEKVEADRCPAAAEEGDRRSQEGPRRS